MEVSEYICVFKEHTYITIIINLIYIRVYYDIHGCIETLL